MLNKDNYKYREWDLQFLMLCVSIHGCILHQNYPFTSKLHLIPFQSSCQMFLKNWHGTISLIRRSLPTKIAISHIFFVNIMFCSLFLQRCSIATRITYWFITLKSGGHFFPDSISRRKLSTLHSTSTTLRRSVTVR